MSNTFAVHIHTYLASTLGKSLRCIQRSGKLKLDWMYLQTMRWSTVCITFFYFLLSFLNLIKKFNGRIRIVSLIFIKEMASLFSFWSRFEWHKSSLYLIKINTKFHLAGVLQDFIFSFQGYSSFRFFLFCFKTTITYFFLNARINRRDDERFL